MRKGSEIAFAVALVPIDFGLALLAAITSYSVRFGWLAELRPVIFSLPYGDFLIFAAGAGAIIVFFNALSGLYSVSSARRLAIEVQRLLFSTSAAVLTLIVVFFFSRELFSSRFIILAGWLLAFLFLTVGRVITRLTQRLLLRFGVGTRRVALVGTDERTAGTLTAAFRTNPSFGFKVVSTSQRFDDGARAALSEMAKSGQLDDIIVSDPDMGRETLERVLGFAQARQLGFRYAADPLATHAKNIEMTMMAGVPVVEIKGTRLDGWGRVLKRIFDIIGSLLLIVLVSPILLVTAIAIVLDSRGPILFSRLDDGTPVTRVGENGRPFRYFKFRSMIPGTHAMRYGELAHLDTRKEGPLVKIKDDPRITRVGRFIRRWSIDELPELFLVLAGKMSLVGPRPHLPEEVAKYEESHRRVFTVKPGITGLAQVSGRADLNFEDEVKLDTWYIENWTPWLDLAILARTPLAVLGRKGAY